MAEGTAEKLTVLNLSQDICARAVSLRNRLGGVSDFLDPRPAAEECRGTPMPGNPMSVLGEARQALIEADGTLNDIAAHLGVP